MFRATHRLNNFCKKFIEIDSLNTVMNKIKLHNVKHIDHIEINIYNPKTVSKFSVFRQKIFQATIHFENNGLQARKEFSNNELNLLTRDINEFLDKEIKV
jgi:hypothetical protein